MDANLITALAGVLGSVTGASAAIATTWISQRSQTVRERAKWETRKRETLYGDFITEASRLVGDAFDHSLDKPETLVKLYANSWPYPACFVRRRSGRRPKKCCDGILKFYAQPNRTMAEIFTTLHSGELEVFKHFSEACRVELRKYSVY